MTKRLYTATPITKETCLTMDDDFFLQNQLYRVPLAFDPNTLLSGIEHFDLDAMQAIIDPDGVDKAHWRKELQKLEHYTPSEWLEGQLLKTLLHVLNVISDNVAFHRLCVEKKHGEFTFNELFHFTKINHKKFKNNCPRIKNHLFYHHAVLILAGFGVVGLNKSYSTGEGDFTAFPKSFRFGLGYHLPGSDYIAVGRPRTIKRPIPKGEAGSLEHTVQSNLLRVNVDEKLFRKVLNDHDNYPDMMFQLVRLWRDLLTNPYVYESKSGELHYPLRSCPRQCWSCLTLN